MKQWMQNNLKGDPIIWAIVFALSLLSILVVYSATGTLAYSKMGGDTEYYLVKHSTLTLLSLAAMWVAHKIDYRYYSKLSKLALWGSVPLLLFTYFFGSTVNEASRWLTIPVINQAFQPSDLAKLALFVTIASILAKRQQSVEELKESLIPILLWCGVICGMIGLTNFSTAVLTLATCMLVMFIGRVPVRYLAMLMMIGILSGTVALTLGQRGKTVVSRVEAFLTEDEQSIPFQAQQAYIAIAGGGLTGKGPGQSDQRNFLPHPYSDFIYAIIIEEYGMVGGIGVLLLYLALLYRGMRVFMQSERAYGGLLSAALSFALVLQAMINMGVAVGLGPITGLPLPLISMGGTSQLFMGISIGIILSVSRGELDEMPGDTKGNAYRKTATLT